MKKHRLKKGFWFSVLLVCFAIGCGDSHYEKANLHLKAGRLDQAEQEFKLAIAGNPNATDVYIKLGQVYIAKKNYDAALKTLEKVIELKPTSALAQNQIARVYIAQKQPDLAIQAGEKSWPSSQTRSSIMCLG